MAKELKALDDDEQDAEEVKGKDDDEEVRAHGEDAEIDVDQPSKDDDAETKAERRKARYNEIESRAQAAEDRARAAEERAMRLEGEFNGFRQQSQQRQEPQKDEHEERIQKLTAQRAQKLQLIRSAVGNEEATNALAMESMELEAQISKERMAQAIKAHMGTQPQQQVNVGREILQAETPQIYDGGRVQAYAKGTFDRIVATGSPASIETARKANQMTLKDLGLVRGPAPAASESQRRAVGGMSGGGGAPTPTGKVKLSRSLRKIATARASLLSPNDDDSVSQKKFAKRLREKGIA